MSGTEAAAHPTDLDLFVRDNVPERCRLNSAVIEFAARERRLEVSRFDRAIIRVRVGPDIIPFYGLNGPDTSDAGRLFRANIDGQRQLLTRRAVPVPLSATFAQTQRRLAQRYAERVGWPIGVRPARRAGNGGVTADVHGEAAFDAAWRRAVRAYGRRGGPVLIDRQPPGERYHVFVVDDEVRAVSHLAGDGVIDVTDHIDPRCARIAAQAVRALPNLAYAGVDLVCPAIDDARAGDCVVTHVDCSPRPIAHFPTQGQPRDVAGAVVEHYIRSPRWTATRRISHRLPAGGSVEPLFRPDAGNADLPTAAGE